MLQGHVAVVTGASKGTGREIARKFASKGVKLAIMGSTDEIYRVKSELQKEGIAEVLAFRGDIAKENDIDHVIQAATNAYGRLDILVNNAGAGVFRKVEDITVEEWMKTFEVNVQGVFLAVKAALPIMKKQQSGTIITISSDVARYTIPESGSLYTSSKYAVQGFMGSLAQEVREHGIRAGTINPGLVEDGVMENSNSSESSTDFLKPADVADVCVYVASAPAHMTIDELQLHPLTQRYPRP